MTAADSGRYRPAVANLSGRAHCFTCSTARRCICVLCLLKVSIDCLVLTKVKVQVVRETQFTKEWEKWKFSFSVSAMLKESRKSTSGGMDSLCQSMSSTLKTMELE